MKLAHRIAMERAEWCVSMCLSKWYQRGPNQAEDSYWHWNSDPLVIDAFKYIRAALEACPEECREDLEQMDSVLRFIRNKSLRELPDPNKSVRAIAAGLPSLGKR